MLNKSGVAYLDRSFWSLILIRRSWKFFYLLNVLRLHFLFSRILNSFAQYQVVMLLQRLMQYAIVIVLIIIIIIIITLQNFLNEVGHLTYHLLCAASYRRSVMSSYYKIHLSKFRSSH